MVALAMQPAKARLWHLHIYREERLLHLTAKKHAKWRLIEQVNQPVQIRKGKKPPVLQ